MILVRCGGVLWLNRVGLGFWGSLWFDLWLLGSNGLLI